MTAGLGYFDNLGNACVKFHLCGVNHAAPGVEFSGIIDTGFTGFLQLPIQHAFQLALPLHGTASATLADGSQTTCLTALAQTTFDGQMYVGAVMLEPQSQDILVGMDFLRRFKLSLIVAKGVVMLLDEDWVEQAVKHQKTTDKADSDAAFAVAESDANAASSAPTEPSPHSEQSAPADVQSAQPPASGPPSTHQGG